MSRPADEAEASDALLTRVQALLQLAAQHDVSELTIESGEFRFQFRARTGSGTPVSVPAPIVMPSPAEPVAPPASSEVTIVAPMIGTFYAGPSPTELPFVTVGDHIEVGQTVAIIEAMKIMNEIESDQTGVLVEVLARNGQGVEFGQPLFRLQPPA